MGTKKGSMERKKLHSEDKDSSVDNQRSDDVTFNLEGDANPNSHETGKREKRKKRKSDNGDGDVESQKAGEKDLVEKNSGDDIVEKDKSGKNTIAKHRCGVEAAENDATEGMSRAKDGSEDEKKRKRKKKKEKNVDGNELSGGRNDGKKVGNERENFMEVGTENGGVMDASENDATERMPRAKDGTEEEKKRKKKKKREKDVDGKELAGGRNGGKEVGNEREYDMEKETENGGVMDAFDNGTGESMDGTEDGTRDEKRRKKKKKRERDGDTGLTSNEIVRKEAGTERELLEDNNLENVEPSRKKRKQKDEHNVEKKDKKKKKKRETDGDTGLVSSGIVGKEAETERELLEENNLENVEPSRKKKKKQKNEHNVEKKKDKKKKRKKGNSSDDEATRRTSKGASKRVSFSENIEIFPSSDGPSNEGSTENKELVRGKRFSQEEDEILRAAVLSYIDQHGLGEEGIKMILKCKKHPEVRNCWKDIAAALPWRPSESVYHRAHVLFERDENRKWTEEEYELVRKFHEKYGADWRTLGDALGKHRFHVKDAWRRINVANRKRGHWSQDEYQSLFDLVNMDLRMRVFEERKSKHGMLRDNISWTAISNKMGTRAMAMCCMKWYDSLSSPMVAEGKWLDLDDYRLMLALYELDACCMEDIDWDNLLEHRPGDVCRKRWNQMVKHLGELQNGSFSDQVEVLMQRYCPDVLEARETYDNKPVVD